ncbi:MAG: hypothetical protein LBS84_00510 [Clostridiales bacterium]|jgi:hypothetical protein|nr:hypothetical protein [Clostridiales bacterium]
MKTHGGLKASITVETALALPIVFSAMFAVLFIVLVMYQSSIQLTVMNLNAENIAGDIADIKEYTDSSVIYDLRDNTVYGRVNYISDNHLLDSVNEVLERINIFKLSADSISVDLGTSVMIRGELTTETFLDINALTVNSSGIASVINPSQYIRETDGKCAILTARTTDSPNFVWDNELDTFLSAYIADLFTKGTFP